MFYNITSDGVTQAIAVTIPEQGKTYQILSTDNRFADVLDRVLAGDESVVDLFNLGTALTRRFEDMRLTDRLAIRDDKLLFDGDEVHGVIVDQILGFLEDGVDDWYPLVIFLEKLYANQSAEVREGLFNWISQQQLTITEDGNFLGYKGLKSDYTSIHAGPGIVNDVETNGHLDNTPGNIVEVARSYVDANSSRYCSTGLHVGTREYATGFAQGKVVVCEVDPRNVVSVPNDGHEKIRTSRYEVIEDVADSYGRVYVAPIGTTDWTEVGFTSDGLSVTSDSVKPKRDSQGRFVKGGQTNPRDAQGRFIKS